VAACGPDDGRHLAEPDPALTAVSVPTTQPAVPQIEGEIPLLTEGPGGLQITSPDFSPGATLPGTSGCGGDEPPRLRWTRSPRRTTSLGLLVQDVDADGAALWVVTGISPDLHGLGSGEVPEGATVHENSFGERAWTSPCPSDDVAHRIVFTLYTLDRDLPVTSEDVASVVSNLQSTAYGQASLLGRASPTVGGG
jgi:phosphatidylethanolamine-binding protein (PEBP) family uncharacterized protein